MWVGIDPMAYGVEHVVEVAADEGFAPAELARSLAGWRGSTPAGTSPSGDRRELVEAAKAELLDLQTEWTLPGCASSGRRARSRPSSQSKPETY